MRHKQFLYCLAVTLLLLSLATAAAQITVVLVLQRAGQATVHIDRSSRTAYIVDLGNSGDGDKVEVGGTRLLDILEVFGIRELAFTCSHPHADHAGGIRALFEQPDSFFSGRNLTKARFESINIIDDGYPDSNLTTTLRLAFAKDTRFELLPSPDRSKQAFVVRSLASNVTLSVQHENATNRNAFAGISKQQDAVFIRNVPYKPTKEAHPHGRSIVTLITLRGGYSLLDFDDSNSAVIRATVKKLQSDGVETIGGFIVPHHGSKYHDLEPIFELKPKTAIIAVNPENPHGHPSEEIVELLQKRLGEENVLRTGSDRNIIVGPNGVLSSKYSADNLETLQKFLGGRKKNVAQEPIDPAEAAAMRKLEKVPTVEERTNKDDSATFWRNELKIIQDVFRETEPEIKDVK